MPPAFGAGSLNHWTTSRPGPSLGAGGTVSKAWSEASPAPGCGEGREVPITPGIVGAALGPLGGFLPLSSLPGALHGAEGSS